MPRVRVFVDQARSLQHAFDFSVTNTDASVYIQPYAREGIYHYGEGRFPPGADHVEVNFREKLKAETDPHISIHQSGQVHIRTRGGSKAGPLQIPPLADLRGQHVATITADRFSALPKYRGERDSLDPERTQFITVDDGVESGRFAIYINGREPSFAVPEDRIAFTATIQGAKLEGPLYVCVAPWGQEPLGAGEGVAALAGFDPGGHGDEFLILRGE